MFVGTTGVDRVLGPHGRADAPSTTPKRWPRTAAIPLDVIQKYIILPLLGVAGPVRLRAVDQRGELLHRRAEGPLAGGAPPRRPPAHRGRRAGRRGQGRRADHRRGARAAGAEPRPAHRIREGLPERHEAVEPGARAGRHRPPAGAAAHRFNRQVGIFSDHHIKPAGQVVGADDSWQAKEELLAAHRGPTRRTSAR